VKRIFPGATIGILGSGQLGRMTALAARAMGYHVAVDPNDRTSPTGQVADRDLSQAAVITYEFENIQPREFAVPVRPGFDVLHVTQNRLREKTWLRDHGIPVTPFIAIGSERDFDDASYPCVLKTTGYGYDGKGQAKVASAAEARAAWTGEPAILEQWIPFRREISVVAARGVDGCFAHYGVIENDHANHILDISRAPVDGAETAVEIARAIFDQLGVVGLACVEFFETHAGEVMVNEIAPRPHNSGHLTIEACATSQFEQQVRAVCGLPLGSTEYIRAGAMANLLGDLWSNGTPNWGAALQDPRIKLHLYGKSEPLSGRKMGHLTAIANTVGEAEAAVRSARERLHPACS
jgi:5-(carboxyamino)imidazole ribonucleotide synthase